MINKVYRNNINTINTMQEVKFVTRDKTKFFRTLNKRVNNYFKENNLKKTGNWKLSSL